MQKQIEQLYNPLLMYIRRRINDQLDAEDLTQEVFYKLSKSDISNVKNIKSWVYTIAKNAIIDYYRKKKNNSSVIDEFIDNFESSDNNRVKEFANCCVLPFVNQLPEDYKQIMKLSELEEIPQKEIAERLNMNYVTVRSRVQRGRQKLKQLISDCCIVVQGGKGSIIDFVDKDCKRDC